MQYWRLSLPAPLAPQLTGLELTPPCRMVEPDAEGRAARGTPPYPSGRAWMATHCALEPYRSPALLTGVSRYARRREKTESGRAILGFVERKSSRCVTVLRQGGGASPARTFARVSL